MYKQIIQIYTYAIILSARFEHFQASYKILSLMCIVGTWKAKVSGRRVWSPGNGQLRGWLSSLLEILVISCQSSVSETPKVGIIGIFVSLQLEMDLKWT